MSFYPPICKDSSHRFAVDSKDTVYITGRWQQTLIAATRVNTYSTSLSWGALEVHARQLLCERVESSIVQDVFPNLKLSADGAECTWALFHNHIGLYHVDTETLAHVTPPSTWPHACVDGPCLVLPQPAPQLLPGTIFDATSFLRLKYCIVILERHSTFRLMDLRTWTLRTIVTLEGTTCSIYPTSLFTTPLPFIASEASITIEREAGVFHLDLETGKTSKAQTLTLHGHTYDRFLPIPSSRNVPTYIARKGRLSYIIRVVNGMVQKKEFAIGKGHCAAHVASTGLTLKRVKAWRGHSTIDTSFETSWELHEAPPLRLFPHDLSSLINSEHFPLDLTIKHCSQKWEIPLDIVLDLHPRFNGRKLEELIKPFPAASVDALMGRLLGKPLPDVVCVESCRTWSHVSYLWSVVGDGMNPVLDDFISSVLPSLPDSVASDALIALRSDTLIEWKEEDPFIHSLTCHVRNRCSPANPLLPHTRAFSSVAMITSVEYEDNEVIEEDARGLTPKLVKKASISMFGALETLLAKPTDFLFRLGIYDEPCVVIGDIRYLYARWKWFKRLMDAGGPEKKNRITEKPKWMSPAVLLAIVGTIQEEWFKDVLSVSDAFRLLEHRQEIDICDADDTPVAPFMPLYDHCMTLVFDEVTPNNILEQTMNYQRLGMVSKLETLLSLMASGKYGLDHRKVFRTLPWNLIRLLKAEADRLSG